jgi:hypothetical protein
MGLKQRVVFTVANTATQMVLIIKSQVLLWGVQYEEALFVFDSADCINDWYWL